jgi:hypothetical protein
VGEDSAVSAHRSRAQRRRAGSASTSHRHLAGNADLAIRFLREESRLEALDDLTNGARRRPLR